VIHPFLSLSFPSIQRYFYRIQNPVPAFAASGSGFSFFGSRPSAARFPQFLWHLFSFSNSELKTNKMKKIIFFLALFVGSYGLAEAQSAARSKAETNFSRKVLKHKKQMHHFDKMKADPNMKHNGTTYHKGEKYKVDTRCFKSPKKFEGRAAKARKTKNKTFGTYVMSIR
jgi:hypothetical protein